MALDLGQLSQRLKGLQQQLKDKPSLRRIIDPDLDHTLNALRLMGVLPAETTADEPTQKSAITPRHNRHGGHREGAGRKRLYRSDAEKKRAYRHRVSVSTKSNLQVADFIRGKMAQKRGMATLPLTEGIEDERWL